MKQIRLLFSTFRGHGVARQTSTMLFCAAILGATILLASTPGDLNQKEIRTQRPHIDGGVGELTSLDELVKLSDAVVIGRVTGSRSSNLAPAGLPPEAGLFLSTAYRMNLGTVVVWPEVDVEKPKSIEVELLGVGDHDRGNHIARLVSERYRLLVKGQEYLIFLRRYRLGPEGSRVTWVPATSDGQSIIEIRHGRLAPQAATSLALDLAKLSPSVLVNEVSRVRKKGGR